MSATSLEWCNRLDEHKLIRERERAALAQQILENPIWQEAWEGYSSNLRAHMESAASSDDVVLEAHKALVVLKRVRKHIEQAVETGRMADLQLERSKDGESRGSQA